MEQEVVVSRQKDVKAAVAELCANLKKSPKEYNAVIFMSAISYDFHALSLEIKSRFPSKRSNRSEHCW